MAMSLSQSIAQAPLRRGSAESVRAFVEKIRATPAARSQNSFNMPAHCAVCFEAYNQDFHMPLLFSCGHMFCMECVHTLTSTP
jgi:hypothetical protein